MKLKYKDIYTTYLEIGSESICVPANYYDIIKTALINAKYYLDKYYNDDNYFEDTVHYNSIHFPLLSLKDTSKYRLDIIVTTENILLILYKNNIIFSEEIYNTTE